MNEIHIPLTLEFSARYYCRMCNTWGDADSLNSPCGNCTHAGFLIDNPFPGNLVPYIVMREPVTSASLDAIRSNDSN